MDPRDPRVLDRLPIRHFTTRSTIRRPLSFAPQRISGSIASADQVVGALVGCAELPTFAKARQIFVHAHMVMPHLGFGAQPRWEVADVEGEPIVLRFRRLDGIEGLNEVHRLEVLDGLIVRVRTCCFCPETLAVVAAALGLQALGRPYRSPSLRDVVPALIFGRRETRPRA